MTTDWEPGDQIAARLTMAGIPQSELTPEILGEFKSYWLTRDDELTQSEWEHKLIKNTQAAWRKNHADRSATGNSRSDRDAVRDAISDVGDRSWTAGL